MSVAVVVERREGNALAIPIEEWMAVVCQDHELRLRAEPYVGVNPATGASIRINVGEADGEILVQGQWLPFLSWAHGTLLIAYQQEFETAQNPIRAKVAAVARALGAIVGTDAGDEALPW